MGKQTWTVPVSEQNRQLRKQITKLEDVLKNKNGITVVKLSAGLMCADIGNIQDRMEKAEAKLDAVNQLKRWTILGATELTKNSQHPPFWVNAHDLAAIGKQGNDDAGQ